MAENMSVTGPVLVNQDSSHRVAWEVVLQIDACSLVEKDKKDERYWLTLFEHALAVANKGQVRIIMGDKR
jgi:hypothetical protein